MGIIQEATTGKKGQVQLTFEEELAQLHLGHKGFFIWERDLGIKNYSFSDFLLQIKLCTYNDDQILSENKLIPCISNVIKQKEKIDLLTPIFKDKLNNLFSFTIDDIIGIFFLLAKAEPLTSKNPESPLYDKAYYFVTKCSEEGSEAISLKAFAAFILNNLLPMLQTLINCYRKIKKNELESNEKRLETIQDALNKNKTQFFSYILSSGATESITIQELNQRFVGDQSFLTADYFISAYLQQAF